MSKTIISFLLISLSIVSGFPTVISADIRVSFDKLNIPGPLDIKCVSMNGCQRFEMAYDTAKYNPDVWPFLGLGWADVHSDLNTEYTIEKIPNLIQCVFQASADVYNMANSSTTIAIANTLIGVICADSQPFYVGDISRSGLPQYTIIAYDMNNFAVDILTIIRPGNFNVNNIYVEATEWTQNYLITQKNKTVCQMMYLDAHSNLWPEINKPDTMWHNWPNGGYYKIGSSWNTNNMEVKNISTLDTNILGPVSDLNSVYQPNAQFPIVYMRTYQPPTKYNSHHRVKMQSFTWIDNDIDTAISSTSDTNTNTAISSTISALTMNDSVPVKPISLASILRNMRVQISTKSGKSYNDSNGKTIGSLTVIIIGDIIALLMVWRYWFCSPVIDTIVIAASLPVAHYARYGGSIFVINCIVFGGLALGWVIWLGAKCCINHHNNKEKYNSPRASKQHYNKYYESNSYV